AADVVVCRAGGSSLSELSVVGVPAILVPYPFATDDHQARNAASFRDRGAAVVVPDRELSGTRLVQELTALLDDPQRGETMRRQALSAGFPEAAEHLLSLVLALT
ncbi:MAG: undecaprenyldiphospho-muramoylpentapeptide beta-N-acetylglucosaminyltransferase, partial [Armatimonadetes bacterium CG17_big_fil_post_rev_8_21_14_2_50_66_6]